MTNSNTILFVNKTDLPILVESWVDFNNNMLKLKTVSVEPYEEKIVYSKTKEWYVTSYFYDKKMKDQWSVKNLRTGDKIGKFRSEPSYSGEYTWMNVKEFNLIYEDNKILFLYDE